VSENSSIEWTDTTWNPVTGCTKVSPGCAHCYAETFAERFRGVPGHPFEQGFDLKLWPERLSLPLGWKKPRRVFVNSMSDLFHESVPFEFIDRVFAVIALTPQHTYQVLTKRPERMREYLTRRGTRARIDVHAAGWMVGEDDLDQESVEGFVDSVENDPNWNPPWPLPNVWLGTSTENQHWLDIRVPELLATPAAVRFLSCEPLLGPLDLRPFIQPYVHRCDDGEINMVCTCAQLDWVIVGGESGPKARPMDIAWARWIVAQCRAAGTKVFVKQLGKHPYIALGPGGENPAKIVHYLYPKSRKGGDMAEWPEDLRVREFPVVIQ
jgi:protein gp37